MPTFKKNYVVWMVLVRGKWGVRGAWQEDLLGILRLSQVPKSEAPGAPGWIIRAAGMTVDQFIELL